MTTASANWHKQGVVELYTYHATNIIKLYEERNTVESISRAKVERQIMKELDKTTFPIDYKLAWYNAVCSYCTHHIGVS